MGSEGVSAATQCPQGGISDRHQSAMLFAPLGVLFVVAKRRPFSVILLVLY